MEYIYMYTEIKMSLVWSGPVSQGSTVIYASSQVWCMLQAKARAGILEVKLFTLSWFKHVPPTYTYIYLFWGKKNRFFFLIFITVH